MSEKGRNESPSPQMMPIGGNRKFGGGVAGRFAPSQKASDTKGTLRKLMQIYLKQGKPLFAVFLLLLCSNLVLLYVPRLIGKAVDEIGYLNMTETDYRQVTTVGMIIIVAYFFDYLCNTIQGWIMSSASQRIVCTLRGNLFAKIQKLPLFYHDTHAHGDLMSRLTNDIDNISITIAASTSQLLNSVVTVIGSVIFMLLLSVWLTPIVLIALPLVIFLTKGIAARSRKMFREQQRELGILNGMIEENIYGLRMVKAFNQGEHIVAKFDETNKKLLHHSTRAQIWSGFLMPLMNVITNLIFALVAGVGGILALKGYLSVGVIASFITYSRLFVRPLNDIAGTFNTLQSALAGAERVFDVMAEAEEAEDLPDAIDLHSIMTGIEFQEVSFSYGEGKQVLDHVSFTARKGQTIALVGRTGAGKTTIVNLLTRFYDVTDGRILIDGKDIKEYTRKSLLEAFTVVLQDTCLFTGSISDNIRYGNLDATEEEIRAAANAANADSFIRRLPHGYNTMVSGSVDTLSSGQKQLIAIARAVLCPAPILILDEATSNVDATTERKTQQALARLGKGRTSFVIAHRLSTIKNADRILVIEDGKILESGSHEELIAKNGTYANMYYA